MEKRIPVLAVTACFAVAMPLALVCAQMLDPAIDRDDEPFCYFNEPTDVIGHMDAREGTLITPEGYLYTGSGELMFFIGSPPEPVDQRVKTLLKGYLPVVRYRTEKHGVEYDFSLFAATLDGNPESPLVNFIRVRIRNVSPERRTSYFSVATRYQGDANTDWGVGDNRFGRPAKAQVLGQYEQSGVEYNPDWEYAFLDDAFVRDGKVMYLFPTMPTPMKMMTLKTGYNEPHELFSGKLLVLPTTPVGIVTYKLRLEPNAEQVLDVKMPYDPLPISGADVARLRAAPFEEYLDRTVTFWEEIIAHGIEISLPEEKVVNTFRANLIYDLIARDKVDAYYIQKVNEFQYDAFWLRDASYIVRMYDISGYHDIARQCLEFFRRWQQPDGNFVSQGGQYDGWGQALWAFGQHYRITHDRTFAEQVYPFIERAVEWLRRARRADPLHVMPVTTPGDNENITGHVTGHNFWALTGLRNAIAVVEGLGKHDKVDSYRREFDDFRSTLVGHLRSITEETSGYIPPGLDSLGGQDWGNMMSLYPHAILDPFDPMVTATLEATRAKYEEGIMTYGDGRWLHHYLTMKNTETEVIRGEQERAIRAFYAILAHTSATHAGFEFSILPWKTRDFGMNLAPHGWFAAKFRTLLRNMMVREQGRELHLLSCISPAWTKEGAVIAVRRAPTNFGMIGLVLECRKTGAVLTLSPSFIESPERIFLHLPWFMDVRSVRGDGQKLTIDGSSVVLPVDVRRLEINWSLRPGAPDLSYESAVNEYKREYLRRYEEFLRTGN